jgi:hypothetical protein
MKNLFSALKWGLVGTVLLVSACKKDINSDNPAIADHLKSSVGQEAGSRTIITIAGNFNKPAGLTNGTCLNAVFSCTLMEVVEAPDGSLYLNDQGNSVIRKVSTDGTVSTFAGVAGSSGNRNGEKNQALFNQLTGLDINLKGDLYFLTKNLDNNNWQVKVLSSDGIVSVVTDLDSTFSGQLAVTSDDIFFARKHDMLRYNIRQKCLLPFVKDFGPSLSNSISNLSVSKTENYVSFSLTGYLPTSREIIYKIDNKERISVDQGFDIFFANDITFSSEEGVRGIMYYGLRNRLVRVNLEDGSYEHLAGIGEEGGQQVPKDGKALESYIQPKYIFLSKDKRVIYFTENNQQGRSGLLRKYTF